VSAPDAPEARATSFEAVSGEPQTEHYDGTKLVVSAYAAFWLVILAWIGLTWRKQRALDTRIDDLERAIDVASRKGRTGDL
jgi:hypothetical protein